MNQLPTWKDMQVFFTKSWKIIVASMVAFLLVYAGGLWYTQKSQEEMNLYQQKAILIGTEEAYITQEAYEQLQKEKVSFSFYVEDKNDVPFLNFTVLKDYLLSPDVISSIKEGLDLTYTVPDSFVIHTGRDMKEAMHITVGAGSLDENAAIAYRLHAMLKNGSFPFFEGKDVYNLTLPNTVAPRSVNGTTQLQDVQPINRNYVQLGIIGLIISFLFGLFVAVAASFFKRDYQLTGLAHFNKADEVISLNHLRNEERKQDALLHSLIHPVTQTKKLVLFQDFDEDFDGLLGGFSNQNLILKHSLVDVTEAETFSEVIIIVQAYKTQKSWFKDQQILLKNYQVPMKVILI